MGRFTISVMLFLLVSANSEPAGNDDILGKIRAKVESMRIREYPPEIKVTDEELKRADPNQVLAVLASYEQDAEWSMRQVACTFMVRVANIQEELPRLKRLLGSDPSRRNSSKWYLTLGWHTRLARAWMGVKEDIKRCIRLAESEQDATERVLRILPDIGYIRRPEAIAYLRKYLECTERLPPINPGMLGEFYAGRVMHIFAESLQDYPVKQKPARGYTEQEIELCRRWMANKANWKIIR